MLRNPCTAKKWTTIPSRSGWAPVPVSACQRQETFVRSSVIRPLFARSYLVDLLIKLFRLYPRWDMTTIALRSITILNVTFCPYLRVFLVFLYIAYRYHTFYTFRPSHPSILVICITFGEEDILRNSSLVIF